MKLLPFVSAMAFGTCLAWPVSATVLVKDLLAYQKSRDPKVTEYIEGVVKGISVASNEAESNGKSGLICPPPNEPFFEPERLADLLIEFLSSRPTKADDNTDVAIPMLYALMKKYPCSGS